MEPKEPSITLTLDKSGPVLAGMLPGRIVGCKALDAETLAWEVNIEAPRGRRTGWYLTGNSALPGSRLARMFQVAGLPVPKTLKELRAVKISALYGHPCQVQCAQISCQTAYPDANVTLLLDLAPRGGWGNMPLVKRPGVVEPKPETCRERIFRQLRELQGKREAGVSNVALAEQEKDLRAELGRLEEVRELAEAGKR